jgi:hypothetical protein
MGSSYECGLFSGINYWPPSGTSVGGILFGTSVQTPSGWAGGYWNSIQMVNLGRNRVSSFPTNQSQKMAVTVGTTTTYYTNGLDTQYPYDPPEGGRGAVTPPGSTVPVWNADGTTQYSEDAPGAEATPSPNSYPFTYTYAEPFKMFIMYLPPGTGSDFVPVCEYDWSWNGTLAQIFPSPFWSLTSPLATEATVITSPSFPIWSVVINSSGFTWVSN